MSKRLKFSATLELDIENGVEIDEDAIRAHVEKALADVDKAPKKSQARKITDAKLSSGIVVLAGNQS